MSRILTILAISGAVVIGYIGSQLRAQPVVEKAPPHTRIAFVNIVTVFQKYKKATRFKAEMEKTLEVYKEEAKKLRNESEEWANWLKKKTDASAEDRTKAEAAILTRKRRLEDINREVQKIVGQLNEKQVIELYKEVSEGVRRYAVENGFHAVLALGDAEPSDPELWGFANISRKVQGMEMAGGVSPMHMVPGQDISHAVVVLLNRGSNSPEVKGVPVSKPGQD